MKILISAFEKQFFQGKEWLFKDVDFNEMWRNEIENNNEKITSRSGDTVTPILVSNRRYVESKHSGLSKLCLLVFLKILARA